MKRCAHRRPKSAAFPTDFLEQLSVFGGEPLSQTTALCWVRIARNCGGLGHHLAPQSSDFTNGATILAHAEIWNDPNGYHTYDLAQRESNTFLTEGYSSGGPMNLGQCLADHDG